ncbi:MAG TPA: nitrilase-related carbon-nitrogen hydrolase [Povalibacter sp.]|nr:nitrilase-related carbon-nitrogen hydrolase [Povalibacter sp.]
MRYDSTLFGWFAALASGVLFMLSRDLGPVGPLVLLAPVPLLVFAMRSTRPLLVIACAFIGRALGMIPLLVTYAGSLPAAALAAVVLLYAIEFAVIVLATRFVANRRAAWLAVLSFPLLSTASEYLLSVVSPHGSFGALGYSLVDVLPILQLASIGGVTMLSFMASLFSMTLAMLVARPEDWRVTASIGAAPWLAATAFGMWRLEQPYDSSAHVALAAVDSLTMHAVAGEKNATSVAEDYAALVRELGTAKPGLQFVVLPEKVFANRAGWDGKSLAILQEASDQTGLTIVAGFDEDIDSGQSNTARVLSPRAPQQLYLKRRLIPGLESQFRPGSQSLVDADHGVAICKDLDFPDLIRDYGRRQTRLLLVPAWDFVSDGRLHARMALVRGVENGSALARAAAMGRLTVSDAFGRVVAERVTDPSSATVLDTKVGLVTLQTVYVRFGDTFAWVVVAGALVCLAWAARRNKAQRTHP